MTEGRVRLLSPSRRRIWEQPPVNAADPIEPQEKALERTRVNLRHLGWVPYIGPAVTDARGWVQDGTDPALVPLPHQVAYPKTHGKG